MPRAPSAGGSRRLSDVEEGGGAGAPGVEGALDDLVPLDEGPDGGIVFLSHTDPTQGCPAPVCASWECAQGRQTAEYRYPRCWMVRLGSRRRRARAHARGSGAGKQHASSMHGRRIPSVVSYSPPCQAGMRL